MSESSENEGGGPGKAFYRTLAEASSDIITVVDSAGTIMYANGTVETVLGYEPDEVTGTDGDEYVHPADRDSVTETFDAVRAAPGESRTVEFRARSADGSWCWVEATMQNLLDDIDGIVVSGRDVTGHRERERELVTTKERMELALQGANLGIWDWNMQTDEVSRDELLTEMLGYTQAEMGDRMRGWEEIVHPDDEKRHNEALSRHISDRTPYYQCDHRLRTKSGDWKWVRTTGKVVERDENGSPVRAVGIHQDIDDRKEYERAIEQAREELRQVIDLIPDPIFVQNRDDELLLTNEANAKMVGSTREEIEGEREPDVFPDTEHYEKRRQRDLDVMDSGESMECKETVTTTDGTTRIFQTTRIPFDTAKADGDAVLGYARDVTDLKEYEQELEEQRDNLEILNQVVRHDIRNKLQLVLAYADILQSDVEAADEEYVEQVLGAAHDAVEITTTARDVTEVMLQSDVDHHPVRLRTVLEDEVEDVRSNYDSALVRLDGPLPAVEVMADDMLASVFRNLLTNAIQHNDKEIPEVTVSAASDDGRVLVRVADNGPGIPDDRKGDIFEQGEMGLDSDGTGLGLYLVDTLVDRYGGEVRVEDNDPDGAIFVMALPITDGV